MSEVKDHGWELKVTHAARPGFNRGLPKTMVVSWHKTRGEAVQAAYRFQLNDTFKMDTMTTTVEPATPKPEVNGRGFNALWL